MKKEFFIIIIIAMAGIWVLCHNRCDKINNYEMILGHNVRPVEELKELVLLGDTKAYDELQIAYLKGKYGEECLTYSRIMADKYNYPRAYFHVYYYLTYSHVPHSTKIDRTTIALALKYLKKGVSLRDPESTSVMGALCLEGKYVPKDTVLGKSLLKGSQLAMSH